MSHRVARQLVPAVLAATGALLVVGFLAELGFGLVHQQQLDQRWRQSLTSSPAPALPRDPVQTPAPVDGVDFAVRVPRLGYFAAVGEGVDSDVLINGPGHYPKTPWPGQPGNDFKPELDGARPDLVFGKQVNSAFRKHIEPKRLTLIRAGDFTKTPKK